MVILGMVYNYVRSHGVIVPVEKDASSGIVLMNKGHHQRR
jgi:hypothetical protein